MSETKMALLKTSYKESVRRRCAGTILDSASDEIRGMLWEEVKRHVEEELEELKEAAKRRKGSSGRETGSRRAGEERTGRDF